MLTDGHIRSRAVSCSVACSQLQPTLLEGGSSKCFHLLSSQVTFHGATSAGGSLANHLPASKLIYLRLSYSLPAFTAIQQTAEQKTPLSVQQQLPVSTEAIRNHLRSPCFRHRQREMLLAAPRPAALLPLHLLGDSSRAQRAVSGRSLPPAPFP